MINRTLIKHALSSDKPREVIKVAGWVRTRRDAKHFSFLELNDGTCLKNIQVIADRSLSSYGEMERCMTGASMMVTGKLVPSQGKNQIWEIQASEINIIGEADTSYPLQKKGHSLEFLREISHLRTRSNLFGCIFRVRNRLAFAIHNFFQERDFIYIHTPIITGSDCEGGSELFRVTTFDLDNIPNTEGEVDFEEDFFQRPTYLTGSGQLEAEAFACSMSNVYTFGPTFRSENSHTSRHASEFWMIEPEIAFCDLEGDMDLAESFIKYLIEDIVKNCPDDLQLFARFVDKGLMARLKFVLEKPFKRITYKEALEILRKSGKQFEYPVEADEVNLHSEHERFLTEEHFKTPVTVYNYPKSIKPFYMRQNADGDTVAAMDVLVPGIGEIIGGSQREERFDLLEASIENHRLDKEEYWWYIQLRKFGTVPHSGFGLGFDRMLMYITGVANIRDVIPFARTPGNAEF